MSDKIEITVDQITEDISIEVSPVGIQGIQGEKGDKGDPFTFSDFTPEQIESLKIKGDKGDAFTYSDFTPEQIEGLKVKGDKGDEGEKGDKGEPFTFEDLTQTQKAEAFNTFFANYYDPAIVSLSARGTTFHKNLHQVQHELDKLEHKPTIYTDMSVTSEGKLHSVIPSDGSGDWTVDRNCEATYVDKDGLIKIAPPNTPRIDWSTGEPMLLVEGQSTNLIRNSSLKDISKWDLLYTENNVSIWRDEGDYNIIECVADNNRPILQEQNIQVEAGKEYTVSVWVHSLEGSSRSVIAVYGNHVDFSHRSVPDGVEFPYRLEMTVIPFSSGPVVFRIGLGTSASTTGKALLSRPQLEEGSTATSYIPTNGSIATRLGDMVYQDAPLPSGINTEGVLFADIKGLEDGGNTRAIMIADGVSDSNRIGFYLHPTAGKVDVVAIKAGSSNVDINITNQVQTDRMKIAVRYKTDGTYQAFLNGELKGSESYDTNLIPLLNRVNMSYGRRGTLNFEGLLKNIKYYPTPLSDEQLIALTTR